MSFVQLEFVAFFAIVLSLYWLLPRRGQNLLLVASSAVFYGWIHPWFLYLLYGSALLDFGVGLAMARWPQRKKWLLCLSLAGNLGMLATFKYLDFFIQNFAELFRSLGLESGTHSLGLLLPVGISFYTFQTMSYTLDIYRGELEPRTDLLDYVVFVSFFPQLVAGPIERAKNLLPQVEQTRHLRWDDLRDGLGLAVWGAFKKICIADTLAPYVDQAFLLRQPSGPLIWAATLGFCIQILADFSGYTDIARGTARMLGFRLRKNFNHPYLATSPLQFWKRWHISFSTWMRDYVFRSLGGAWGGPVLAIRNITVTLLLSGLWHGASWNFVLSGAFHAVLILAQQVARRLIPKTLRRGKSMQPVNWAVTQLCVFLGFMIFRERRLEQLFHYWTLSPFVASFDQWVATWTLLTVSALCASPLILALLLERGGLPRWRQQAWFQPLESTVLACLAVAVLTFARPTAEDFIYFQF